MPRAMTIEEALGLARELCQSGRLDDSAEVCAKILAADPGNAGTLHVLGIVEYRRGEPEAAERCLTQAAKAGLAAAANDLGNVRMQSGWTEEAITAYLWALEMAPDFPAALNNLGNARQMAGQLEESVDCYQRALRLEPRYAEAHRNLGSALERLGRNEEAAACFRNAVSLNPGFAEAVAQQARTMLEACDWSKLEAITRQLVEMVESEAAAVNPYVFLLLETTARQQWLCARRWSTENVGAIRTELRDRRSKHKITVGYLSADFQEHATAQLTAELFTLHDRNRFRVIGYSYGANDGGAMRRRLMANFDEFVDLENVSHPEAAGRIASDGVDILVDLKGYTRDARPPILAMRPAPIQVSYLGFPGTMGTEAVDYILADRFVIPEEMQRYFTESVVYLPDCYQVNNSRRKIADRTPSREECGLPEAGIVFCCFNGAQKLTPAVFRTWMRLLAATEGSVLWLLESNAAMAANLRKEAEAQLPGSAARLVFAPILPNPDHLARLRLADLFLDTLPYNAHTLTSDALWAGCPVVTCAGDTFPSRVAGSLLQALGVPELVTYSAADYEALALGLAREPERLQAIREKITANRTTAPLFDCRRFTRHLESAFETMWRRYQAGEGPAAFAVDADS